MKTNLKQKIFLSFFSLIALFIIGLIGLSILHNDKEISLFYLIAVSVNFILVASILANYVLNITRKGETDLQVSTENLRTKDALLQAVAAATHELISNENSELAIGNACRRLGLSLQTDYVSVYKNEGDLFTDGHTSQLMRWSSVTNEIQYRHPGLQSISCMSLAFDALSNNNIVNSFVRDLEDPLLQKLLTNHGVLSTAAIPLFTSAGFWGFVSFNDKEERVWTETEIAILKSFALTLGSAIDRHYKDEQLVIAKESAEAASVAKCEFIANISHELRTPMNSIIGFTELTLASRLEKTQREYLSNVSRSAYDLLGMIDDVLDFGKLRGGKILIQSAEFDLHELIRETVDTIAIKAQEKSLKISCVVDESMPTKYIGDVTRIRQVLMNLLSNAVKFTQKGEIALSISQSLNSGITMSGARGVVFAIRDTGIGISASKLESIFDNFTQADASNTRRFGGTGIGLTISRSLAELMKGSISAESTPAHGSTFTFTIPLEVVKQSSAGKQDAQSLRLRSAG